MKILTNVPLKSYSTMRLGGLAQALTTVRTKDELLEALDWAREQNVPFLVLGEGSNVIVRDEGFAGLVIINRIMEWTILEETDTSATLRIGAGEHWDDVVARTVEQGLSGIERLSLIPGTAGATPVQNVGAYGSEIAQVLTELEAYDTATARFVTLTNSDCHFTYRNSIFKPLEGRHYIITCITLRLSKQAPQPPFYANLQHYLEEHRITEYTPQTIRQAVIALRTATLPDPALIANTGSFFKNPIVGSVKLLELQAAHPHIPFHRAPDGRAKLHAGWLIDHAGRKDYAAHGMKTYEHNALVFINEHAKSYDDLARFKNEIVGAVRQTFGVVLEQEPETIP